MLSSKWATKSKKQQIVELLEEYRKAVNFYIDCCWENSGAFNAVTLRKLEESSLSYSYKGQALRQAMSIVVSTKRYAKKRRKKVKQPVFKGGMDLSEKFLTLSFNANSFDCWAKVSTLEKYHRVWIPCRKTRVFNKWESFGRLLPGGTVFERGGNIYVKVNFELPKKQVAKGGAVLGVDLGINNLIATSDGVLIGKEMDKRIRAIKRAKSKSNGKRRAILARDQYVNECVKQIPFDDCSTLVVEQLDGIKIGKKWKNTRQMNRHFSHWTVGKMRSRIKQLCEENCVVLVQVPPTYTSTYCRACGCVERGNRCGEVFRCVRCGHSDHADIAAARNIRDVYLGTILVPHSKVQSSNE